MQLQSDALTKLKNDLNIKMKPLYDALENEEKILSNEKKEVEKEQKKLDDLKKKFKDLEKQKKKSQQQATAPPVAAAGRGRGAPPKK